MQRDIVDMTRCNAKNKQDLDEARSRVSMLENELAEVRGQLAEAQLPPPPSPGSVGVGAGGEKQRMALREQCTALDARLQEVCVYALFVRVLPCCSASHGCGLSFPDAAVDSQAKQDADNLRAQLKDEKAKQKQAQQALVDEQQYFLNKLADMEALTKGFFLAARIVPLLHATVCMLFGMRME